MWKGQELSLAQLECDLKVHALSHHIHCFLLPNPYEGIYEALQNPRVSFSSVKYFLFFFSEESLMHLSREMIMKEISDWDVWPNLLNFTTQWGTTSRWEANTQVYRCLRLFWVTHCSLCWTMKDSKKSILKS